MIEELFGSLANLTTLVTLSVAFLFALGATFKVCGTYDGVAVPTWLIFVWLFPFVGPLITLFYSPLPEGRRIEKSLWKQFLAEEPHRKFLQKDRQNEAFELWREAQGSNA